MADAKPFTPEERAALNALLLHARQKDDEEGFAALAELATDPAAYRKVVAELEAGPAAG